MGDSPCGFCLTRQHDRCVSGGSAWRCSCALIAHGLGNTERFICECGYTRTGNPGEMLAVQSRHEKECEMYEAIWARLDEQCDEVVRLNSQEPQTPAAIKEAKQRANGGIEVFALVLGVETKTVALEVGARFQARQRGETPTQLNAAELRGKHERLT
jgi:hypothetical protein